MSQLRIHSAETVAQGSRPRPAWLRALGRNDPPPTVTIDGILYRRQEIFKHDSWAATAVYESDATATKPAERAICKFNRRQSLLGLPGAWIGRILARREAWFLQHLADVSNVPTLLGPVVVEGIVQRNAVARRFIAGAPLGVGRTVDDLFFPRLADLVHQMHAHGMAYVDLHKHENVLVDNHGAPYLIDFQVCFAADVAKFRPLRRWLLQLLQGMDDYHVAKLHWRFRPDQSGMTYEAVMDMKPRLVRFHRFFAVPLRTLRRKLLTLLGVRRGRGRAESEKFVEAGLRDVRDPHKRAA
jgi:hypothetical protein